MSLLNMTKTKHAVVRQLEIERRRSPLLVTTTCQTPQYTRHRLERIERHDDGWTPVYRCQVTRALRPYGLHWADETVETLVEEYGPLTWNEGRKELIVQPLTGVQQ